MLLTLLGWIYIALTCFITGSFALRRISRNYNDTEMTDPGGCIVCGLCVLTAYAGYFSLFTGVGLAANIVMLVACACIIVRERKKYKELICKLTGSRKEHGTGKAGASEPKFLKVFMCIAAAAVIFVCLYYTAAGRFAYDTGTYHAQSIHWIESFGVVKGLAYMQTRLGFNSSYFCLCALYSMHFLGQSMHVLSGFLAVFTMLYSLAGWYRHLYGAVYRKEPVLRVSDFVYAVPFAYFTVTAIETVSPSTDHGVIWLIIWLCIRWLELIEEDSASSAGDKGMRVNKRTDSLTGYSLLCVLAVFLVSVKLSVGVLALLVIRPAYLLIREKRTAEAVKYILAGILLILPYFIRNILITGWLVYPFPAVDLFNVDWKIPAEGVKYEADEIVVWARYTKDVALIDQSFREWFPVWWSEQGAANRYASVSAFAGAAVLAVRIMISLIYATYLWINGRKGRLIATAPGVKEHAHYVYFGIILLISYAFFMISAPSNRFGYGYILLIPLFAAGDVSVNVLPLMIRRSEPAGLTRDDGRYDARRISAALIRRILPAAAVTFIICFNMLKGLYMFASDDRHYLNETGTGAFPVRQKDYPEADAGSKEWQGIHIYYPVIEGEQIWYHAFPAILYEGNLDGIERRGNSIRDGFRLKIDK